MKQEDKWLKEVRDRMKDYSEPVPGDLWEGIEKELEASPKVIPFGRRWQVAAAVVALLVLSSLTTLLWRTSSADYLKEQAEHLSEVMEAEHTDVIVAEEVSEERLATALTKKKNALTFEAKRLNVLEKRLGVLTVTRADEETPVEEAVPQETECELPSEKVPERKQRTVYRPSARKERKASAWTLGVSAGNVPVASSSAYAGYGRLLSRSLSDGGIMQASDPVATGTRSYEQVLFNNLYSRDVSSDIEHQMPLTFGVSLRRELTERWAVETGVNYTLLSSDLRSGNESYYYKEKQRLHYVGIPLEVQYKVWENRRFELYIAAGGGVEKCVSGELETVCVAGSQAPEKERTDICVDEWQWSLTAQAGAQLKLNNRMGIYVEPGLVYYPDDGSSVNTIRKEHPLNFHVQVGFRFTLPK